jgi:hypothetical protein
MAAQANVTLIDAAAASKTYEARGADFNKAVWWEASWLSTLRARVFQLVRKPPTDLVNGTYRLNGKVTFPVVDATTGALLRVPSATFEFVCPPGTTQSEADEVYQRLKSAVALTITRDAFVSQVTPT